MAMKRLSKMNKCKVIGLIIGVATTLLLIFAPVRPHKTTFVTVPTQYTQMQGQGGYTTVRAKEMKVKATAYYGDTITSTGTTPKVGRTIAVDPSVIPYGTRVYIPEFDKVFIAEDCGGAIKGNKIDIFMNTYKECMDWGIKEITIYILE